MCWLRRPVCSLQQVQRRRGENAPSKRNKFSTVSSVHHADLGVPKTPFQGLRIYPTYPPTGHLVGTNEATMTSTLKNAPPWHICRVPERYTHVRIRIPPLPLSFPTPGKTVPHHPLGDGHQVTVPHPPLGNCTTTVHAHLQAQKLQHKTKEFSIRYVQRAANVPRPTP